MTRIRPGTPGGRVPCRQRCHRFRLTDLAQESILSRFYMVKSKQKEIGRDNVMSTDTVNHALSNQGKQVNPIVPQHCLTYRLKGESSVSHITGTMEEIENFIEDMSGLSVSKVNTLLGSFRKGALNPALKPSKIILFDPFIERQVYPVQDSVNSERYKRIQTELPVNHAGTTINHSVRRIFPPLVINTQTTCICQQTGIAFAVSLPSPIGTGMTVPHPFSFYSNVIEFISQYQKHGKNLEETEIQVLAGIFITVLKHKGYLLVRNAIVLNDRLTRTTKPLLLRAINYFWRKSNNNGLYPVLSLEEISDPSFAILQHIKICEGEDTTVTVRTLSSAKKTIRARIYTDKNKQQFTQAKADIKSAKHILEGLRKRFAREIDPAIFENIETQIDQIIFVTEGRKKEICQFIWDVFNGDEGAKSIIILLRSIETDAVESDLFTLSQEIEREGKEEKIEGLSLMELLAKQKEKA